MPRKTQKEVLEKYRKDRIDFTIIQLIRYVRAYHHCTEEWAIAKIVDELKGRLPVTQFPSEKEGEEK